MAKAEWTKIDIDAVVRKRLPRHSRFIPRFVTRWLSKIICQDQLNEVLRRGAGCEGADFCASALNTLGIGYRVADSDLLPPKDDTKVTYICNHPLGGLDGIVLIDMVARHHGIEPLFVVNDLLMAVEPLRRVFVPINKFGRQSRKATMAVEEAFASDRPIIFFPAGLVSRRKDSGEIADLAWRHSFVNLSAASGRDIIPLFFSGVNSKTFYTLCRRREQLGLKFNYEMIRLPRELVLSRGSEYEVRVGKRIACGDLGTPAQAREQCQRLRQIVYALSDNPQTIQKH